MQHNCTPQRSRLPINARAACLHSQQCGSNAGHEHMEAPCGNKVTTRTQRAAIGAMFACYLAGLGNTCIINVQARPVQYALAMVAAQP